MAVFVWQQEMAPDFPLEVLEYVVRDDRDRMHWHDHLEVALVLEGHGSFRFGRSTVDAASGDVFLIDNSHPHVALAGAEPMRLLLVLFRPELLAAAGSRELDLGYLAPFRGGGGDGSPRIAGETPLGERLGTILRDLRAICERHDPVERHLADATLRLALALVACERRAPIAAQAGCAGEPDAADRERIRPVLAYVERHRDEHVTLEEVAEVVHASPSRVRHVFKDVTGVGFKEYVTQVRVAEAKRLLLATDLSVAEVARAVSYTNLHQFYKVFQRSCAMSPAAYRRYYTPSGGESGSLSA